MPDLAPLLEREIERARVRSFPLEVLIRRRERKRQRERAVAIPVALLLAALATVSLVRAFRSAPTPADEGPTVVSLIAVEGQPIAMAAGPGDIWVLSSNPGTISRIDPRTDQVVATIQLAPRGQAADLAVTDDAVWVALFGDLDARGKPENGSLVRVDPGTNEVVARLPLSGIADLDAGLGSIWALQVGPQSRSAADRTGTLYRVDPTTNEVDPVSTYPGTSWSDARMEVGGGSIWISDGEVIHRVDPETGVRSKTEEAPSLGGLAYANGGLWTLTDCMAQSCVETGLSVRRLDASTGDITTFPLGIFGTTEKTDAGTVDRNVDLTVVAADPRSVWIMAADEPYEGNKTVASDWVGHLIRLDPSTGRVEITTINGYAPRGVIAEGAVWVLDYSHDLLVRVDPHETT
jgi:streptogramin lyase